MKRFLVIIVLLVSVLTIPAPSANADSASCAAGSFNLHPERGFTCTAENFRFDRFSLENDHHFTAITLRGLRPDDQESARKLILAEFADWSRRDTDREDPDNTPGLFASTRPPVWAQAADGVAAPEPASLFLFGMGLLSVVGLRRLFR